MKLKTPRSPRSLAPTHALDHALASLARNDADDCLRRAVPVLDDVGANAAALDVVARAAVTLGNMHLARLSFETGARMLAAQGMASHAIAAALSVERLTGDASLIAELAAALGAEAVQRPNTSVPPPPLVSEAVLPLPEIMLRADVFTRALTRVEALRAKLPAQLPARGRHPLWGALPSGAFERMVRALSVRLCRAGEEVIREGDHSGSLFVIARGEVRVMRRSAEERDSTVPIPLGTAVSAGDELAVLGAETVFGEMALLTAAPRAASAITTRACVLLEAPRDAVDEASREVPALGRELAAWGRRRLVDNLLRTAPLLRGVDRSSLSGAFETRSFAAGEALFRQGDEAPGLHLIVSGRVVVERHTPGAETLLMATMGAGDSVGEVSLVLRRPAGASATATEATVALVLRHDQFMGIVRENPALFSSLYELAVRRDDEMRSVVAQTAEDADTLVLV